MICRLRVLLQSPDRAPIKPSQVKRAEQVKRNPFRPFPPLQICSGQDAEVLVAKHTLYSVCFEEAIKVARETNPRLRCVENGQI